MKNYVNGFLIVEGYADKAFLSSFLDCEVVVLEGFAIPRGTILYIKELSKTLTPILLTDPDEAGQIIRKRVCELINNVNNVIIEFKNRKNYKKHGVAECDKETILKYLKPHLTTTKPEEGNITLQDIYELENVFGVNVKRDISTAFNLGETNTKTMIKRINYLNIKKEEIIRVLKDGN